MDAVEIVMMDLLFRVVCSARIESEDLVCAGWLEKKLGEDAPMWVGVIAGGNPENLAGVLKTAREELGHELLGTDSGKDGV